MTSQHKLDKDKNNGQVKVDGEKTTMPQLYTENYKQLGDAGSRRNILLQGRAH